MARRKKSKDAPAGEAQVASEPQAEAQVEAEAAVEAEAQVAAQSEGDDGPPDNEPTQVDAVVPPEQPQGEEGAEVTTPLAGDTEKLYTDDPPVPPDQPQPDQPEEKLATVTDISSAVEAASEAAEGEEGGGEEGAGEEGTAEGAPAVDAGRMEAIIEGLLFASDKSLSLADLKRLLGERDGKKITAAVEALQARHAGTGILVTSAAGGWQLRTNPEHAPWVGKLLAGRPMRLSRAMLETMAIVAYRQPVTRPEIDDIRGVDCGPVLKTLLERGLVRIIGKKEEVGRPMLYGTTPEFLRVFNLRDLAELPTLREFHELGAEEKAKVDAEHGVTAGGPQPTGLNDLASAAESVFTPHPPLAPDPEEDDSLIDDLEKAAQAAARASGAAAEPAAPPPDRTTS